MAVRKINARDAQAPQTLLARLLHTLRVAPEAQIPILPDNGESGRQEDVVPLAGPLEPFANQLLAVHGRTAFR